MTKSEVEIQMEIAEITRQWKRQERKEKDSLNALMKEGYITDSESCTMFYDEINRRVDILCKKCNVHHYVESRDLNWPCRSVADPHHDYNLLIHAIAFCPHCHNEIHEQTMNEIDWL